MTIDTSSNIDAVARVVSRGNRHGRSVRIVTATRTYDTRIEQLWDALTNPARLAKWFLPISGDLRPGGRYQLEGNAAGLITRCAPPRDLAVTWEFGDEIGWVAVRLAAAPGGGTRLELEHAQHVSDERWEQYGPGAVGVGWDLTLLCLALHLRPVGAVNAEAAEAWTESADGKEFQRQSSEAWCRASIAAGTDAAAASAAAARTTAAYTGEAEGVG